MDAPALDAHWLADARGTDLFARFTDQEIVLVTRCLGTRTRTFAAGEVLVRAGDPLTEVGVVLDGQVQVTAAAVTGSRLLLGRLGAGDVFGVDLLADDRSRTARTVTAATDGRALLVAMGRIVHADGPLCTLRSGVVENLMRIALRQNRHLERQLDIVSLRSLRRRICRFLAWQQETHRSARFTVDYSRAELADFLNVDRSALSRELSRMREERLIDFHRNSFDVRADLDAA
ncbi:MAG TPA: Crp/Fnr family transcriptional regulator [Cellulomonas sp.]